MSAVLQLRGRLGGTGRGPEPFCGKPDPKFFAELCQHLQVAPPGCLLIGDNLESDIAGAKRVGMRTILTLTGVSRQSDVDAAAPEQRPDLVLSDLTALLTA